MGGNGWEGNAAVGSDQQRGYSGESREGLHGDGGAGIGAGHPAGMGLGAGGGVEPEEEDPVLAKARQRRALTTLRFFMRRFVRFHLSRIHSEVKAVQTRFFEIIVYLLFCLFVILSSVTSRQDQDYFWAANAMQSQIVSQEFPKQYSDWVKSFQDVETLEDVYVWMSGPMHTTLYEEDATWWGAFPPNGASNSSAEREGLFFGTNRLIGGVRVSQLRSRERADECVSLAVLAPSSSIRCFAHDSEVFTPDDETTDAAGFPVPLYPFEGSNQSLMQASVAEERGRIGLATFRADSGREYPVPAFTVILPHSGAVRAAAVIEGLWRHGYVDSQTRLLAVSFVVYSPNIDVYVMFDAVVEFTKVGAITVGMETTTARLGTVWESRELFTLVMELLVMLFYVWYTLQELRRTLQVGFRRLLKFTTLAHDLNIFTYVTYWAFKLAAYYAAPTDVVVDSDVYYDFRTAIRMREIARLAMSGTVFIVLFKLLAYTAVIPSFGLLTRTIGNAAGPTISFLLISALLLYGFSAAYMIALGPRAFGFRNLATSATSLLRALLGDFDYEQIRRAHFLIGPILFILFVFLGVVVLLNVIIAIISAAWDTASSDVDAADDARIARLFAQHAWAVVSGLPLIGAPLRSFQRCRHERRKQWVRTVARDITSMPVSLMLKEQPWERIRRKKDKSAASYLPDVFTRALTTFNFRTGQVVQVQTASRTGRAGSKTDPFAAAEEAAAEARFLGEAGISPSGEDGEVDGSAAASGGSGDEQTAPAASPLSTSPTGQGSGEAGGGGSAVDVTALPLLSAAAAIMDRGIDQIKQGDETDPTRAGGPYATPLAREMNTRIALKRKILGETEYRELVRRRVQESVEALVRQHWSEVAAGVDMLQQKQVRRRRRHRERREANLDEQVAQNRREPGLLGGVFARSGGESGGGGGDRPGYTYAANGALDTATSGWGSEGRGATARVVGIAEASTAEGHGSEHSDSGSSTDSDETERLGASGLRARHTAPAAH